MMLPTSLADHPALRPRSAWERARDETMGVSYIGRKEAAIEVQNRETPADLHPKQRLAFESEATEMLYGGAAGGGKSHLQRRAAMTWCRWIPGLQVYIFRRTFPDLWKNHMEGPTSFPALVAQSRGRARIDYSRNRIVFTNGSVIHLAYCQYEKDVTNFQGAEIHVLMIDELTQWTRKMYLYLRARVRLGGLKVPEALRGFFPRILCGANPGGIGHNWVKGDFIDIAAILVLTRMSKKEGGMLRQYVPAKLEDNPTMTENDPDYEDRLEGLGDPALVRAMRSGDWDIVAGGMFDDLWKRSTHVIAPFKIPRTWYINRSFDWGSSKPFSVGWWAESDGTKAPNGETYPRGTLFRIAEWYGWNQKANEGLKMGSADIAKGIKVIEAKIDGHVFLGPADSSIYDVVDDKSIASEMEKHGVKWLPADKSPGSRKNGWQLLRDRLLASTKRPMEDPGLFVFNTCSAGFIRTVPVLPRDETKSDDVDTKAEDHTGDETRYRLLQKRSGGYGQSTHSH